MEGAALLSAWKYLIYCEHYRSASQTMSYSAVCCMEYLDYPLHALNLWLFKFHMNQRKVGSEDLFKVRRMSSKDKLVGKGLAILIKNMLIWIGSD